MVGVTVSEEADDDIGAEDVRALVRMELEKDVVGEHGAQDDRGVLVGGVLVAPGQHTADLAERQVADDALVVTVGLEVSLIERTGIDDADNLLARRGEDGVVKAVLKTGHATGIKTKRALRPM